MVNFCNKNNCYFAFFWSRLLNACQNTSHIYDKDIYCIYWFHVWFLENSYTVLKKNKKSIPHWMEMRMNFESREWLVKDATKVPLPCRVECIPKQQYRMIFFYVHAFPTSSLSEIGKQNWTKKFEGVKRGKLNWSLSASLFLRCW